MSIGTEPPSAVSVHVEQEIARVVVTGTLDADLAIVFATACEESLSLRPSRLELDLSGLNSASDAGVSVIARCLANGRRLDGGVRITVATPAGRRALLDATSAV